MNPEELLEVIEAAQASGKIKKGVNEVTKALERGTAKLVVAASDVSPKEIIMHLPLLAKEKGILYGEVSSKEELGAAAGLPRPTSAIAVLDAGSAKDIIKSLEKGQKSEAKAEEKPAEKEAPKQEPKKEEKAEESKEEVKEVKE